MTTSDPADWPALHAAIKQARIADTPKRAAFARKIDVNDSTLQIIEGARPGRVSDEMLDYVTGRLGWSPDQWRGILHHNVKPQADVSVRMAPRTYADARDLGENLRLGVAVILDLNYASDDLAKRIVDFAAGLAFAMNGRVTDLSDRILLVSPKYERPHAADDDPLGFAAQFGEVQRSYAAIAQDRAGEEDQSRSD